MIRTAAAVVVASALALLPLQVRAATCTIGGIDITGTFPFSDIGGAGVVLPAEIDPATGRFSLDFTPFARQYPAPGLEFPTGFGPNGFLDLPATTVQGTIDGSGEIALSPFLLHFGTDLPGSIVLFDVDPTLRTGLQAQTLSGRSFLFEGRRIGADGLVRLSGADLISFQSGFLTGPSITCRLDPRPDLGALPAGPRITSVNGGVRAGADPARPDDRLTLKVVLATAGTSTVLDGSSDLIVRLRTASGARVVALLLRAGHLTGTKRLAAEDTGNGVIAPITEADPSLVDEDGVASLPKAPEPITGGKVVAKAGRKNVTITWTVDGLDLAQIGQATDLAIAIGERTARRAVKVTSGKKGSKLR